VVLVPVSMLVVLVVLVLDRDSGMHGGHVLGHVGHAIVYPLQQM
jgi:hypothetical protein